MRKLANDRLTATIANGRLVLQMASGKRAELPLPTSTNDLAALIDLRRKIETFGQKNDLSRGQVNAALKKLTEHGHYVAGPQSASKRARWALGQLTEEELQEILRKFSN